MGALVSREPTMNRRFASASSRTLFLEGMLAFATTTMSARPWRTWNCLMIGTIVAVFEFLAFEAALVASVFGFFTVPPKMFCRERVHTAV